MRRIKSTKKTGSEVKIGRKIYHQTHKFSKARLRRDILREGRALQRHPGAVELMADRVIDEVEKWTEGRAEITEADLDRVTAARIRKYDADLAYVFRNRGKII